MSASSYMKVKISPDAIKQFAKECGLKLTFENSVRGAAREICWQKDLQLKISTAFYPASESFYILP